MQAKGSHILVTSPLSEDIHRTPQLNTVNFPQPPLDSRPEASFGGWGAVAPPRKKKKRKKKERKKREKEKKREKKRKKKEGNYE